MRVMGNSQCHGCLHDNTLRIAVMVFPSRGEVARARERGSRRYKVCLHICGSSSLSMIYNGHNDTDSYQQADFHIFQEKSRSLQLYL